MNKELIEELLQELTSTGADFGEVFFENKKIKNYSYIDQKLEEISAQYIKGVGLRIAQEEHPFYAYTNQMCDKELHAFARKLSTFYTGSRVVDPKSLGELVHTVSKVEISHEVFPVEERLQIMREFDSKIRSKMQWITQVKVFFLEEDRDILVANTNGIYASTKSIHTRFGVIAYAKRGDKTESVFKNIGKMIGLELLKEVNVDEWVDEIISSLLNQLDAIDFKGGYYPVLLGTNFGGVLIHEACGHGLEATAVADGKSFYSNLLGKKVGSDVVTIVDDGTLSSEWGGILLDDEGALPKKNILIENGILKSYLVDELHKKKMNHVVTGSGRRESYHYQPTSRMTNTYLAAGKSTFEEMIEGIELGVYCKDLTGGSVNPATGDFNFKSNASFLIENGKVTSPLREISLIGNSKDILDLIEMVGDDLCLSSGYCGSRSGSIYVTVGQPTIKISKILVGGRVE